MFETDWRKLIADPAEKKVFDALEDPKWEWRTVEALSRLSGLPPDRVRRLLDAHPGLVRKSVVPSADGSDLYTLQAKYLGRQSILDKIRISLSANSSSTSTSTSED